jgi:biopolymer transport protein ExbD
MPVKLGSKLPAESEARIEIIPLIDIMFFLLASFMLVSWSMVNLKSIKVNLPTAVSAASSTDSKKNVITISVSKTGLLFIDGNPVGNNELALRLAAAVKTNPDIRVLIHGDQDARHGDVVRALDIVQGAGIDKAGLEIRDPGKAAQ